MKRLIYTVMTLTCLLSGCTGNSTRQVAQDKQPVMMLRFHLSHTETDAAWDSTLAIIKENPGCCDEVWFSTGVVVKGMEWHRDKAERMKRAKQQLGEIGIGSSVQIQMTIGHGDQHGIGHEDRFDAKTWRGWTGSQGVEALYNNCPRQPAFLEYLRQMTRIYAEIKPRYVWIDDDLRFDMGHSPATDGSRIGCWCPDCIAAFNAENGTNWTRETLDAAMEGNQDLQQTWRLFNIKAMTDIATLIAEEVRSVSPETRMGMQKDYNMETVDYVRALLNTLHEVSGKPVGYRVGGGSYYDTYHPAEQIIKSIASTRYMEVLKNLDFIDPWCPEIECYPRVYGSRTAQSILLEGFTALAYGHQAVSMFIMANDKEQPHIYSHSRLRPISQGAPMLRAYARANEGTQPVGYRLRTDEWYFYCIASSGIPLITGIGKDLGDVTEDYKNRLSPTNQISTEYIQLREDMNQRSPSPVVCCSPFLGMIIPRIDAEGALKTIGIINTRIDTQGPARLRLNGLSPTVKSAVWFEMKQKEVKLPIEWTDGEAYVEIPEMGPWNAGFLRL